MEPEKLYLTIINNLKDGVYFVDTERRITFWNKAAEDITGYKKEDIIGKTCQSNLLNHIDRTGKPLCLLGCPLYSTILDGQHRKDEVFLRHRDGYRIPIIVNIFPIKENGEIIGAVEVFTRNSPTVYDDNLIEKLSGLAMNDQLTGLANRRKMESYLEYRLHELKAFNRKFCVIFLNIDDFSTFNNTYGHDAGDIILKNISKSISHNVRSTDLFSRWGGEEFLGAFEIKNDSEAAFLAEKLRVLVAGSEMRYKGHDLSVTASLGVAIADHDDTIDSIVDRADALMYQSKKRGKNCFTSDNGKN